VFDYKIISDKITGAGYAYLIICLDIYCYKNPICSLDTTSMPIRC